MDPTRNSIKSWQELQRALIEQFPLPAGNTGIEKFVHKTLKNFVQHSIPHSAGYDPFSTEDSLEYELFESQRVIFLHCKIPEGMSSSNLRFFANRHTCKIEFMGGTQEIRLPSDISPAQASARQDGDVIEVQLPKSRHQEPFHEITIRE
ncbi:hypothetical protein [Paenibacillus sp. 32352]|uniref:hypothetical protein n=1 Tax=Paenibacillus sp. 32352 TaxID=1969111 RepID=UPI0009AEA8DE|nr:hypothetical protein [Paenibacillus sp. 32352]